VREKNGTLSHLDIAAIAFALAIDAFSVAASVGPRSCARWGVLRLSVSFGLFQGLMPLLGALVGSYLLVYVAAYDHWVAFGLLEAVGVKMLVEAFRPHRESRESPSPESFDPSRGWTLLGLSLATSIDAFGAGISMQVVGAALWFACPLIALVAALLTYIGGRLGVTAARRLGHRAEALGGVVLIALGLKMLQI